MMNKRSSRLIAWLLAMVMILNIAPVTAFADYSNSFTKPVGEAEQVMVHYVPRDPGHKNQYNYTWDKKGNEKTPSQKEAYDRFQGSLAGWSTVENYTDRNSGLLFAPGSYIDFTKFPNAAVPTKLTLYETAAIPVTVNNVNGKSTINGQHGITSLYAVPGEKLEKPADPVSYNNREQFDKWLKADGTEYDFNTIVTKPFTLTASYITAGSTQSEGSSGSGSGNSSSSEVRAEIYYREKTGQETIGGVDPYSENIHPDHPNAVGSTAFVRDGAQNEGKEFSHWTIEIDGTEYSLEDKNDTWDKEALVPLPGDDPFAPTGSDGNKVWTNRKYWAYFTDGSAEDTTTYTLNYEYSGTVPEGAPNVPAGGVYTAGTSVNISQVTDTVEGYTFSGCGMMMKAT